MSESAIQCGAGIGTPFWKIIAYHFQKNHGRIDPIFISTPIPHCR
jgi:hypothetical protein